MFKKTYVIESLANDDFVTEEFTGNYFQLSARLTNIRAQGFVIQSVNKI